MITSDAPSPPTTTRRRLTIAAPMLLVATGSGASLVTGRWSQLEAMRTPHHGLGVAAFGATLYALDGATATGHSQSTRIAEALDLG